MSDQHVHEGEWCVLCYEHGFNVGFDRQGDQQLREAAREVVIQRGRYYRDGVEDPYLSVVPRISLSRLDVALWRAATPSPAPSTTADASEREAAANWRAAEAEGHVVDFTETGFGLQHPPSCRPDLIGCWFNVYLSDLGYPDEEPGRYRMTRHKGHAEYARLSQPDSETTG